MTRRLIHAIVATVVTNILFLAIAIGVTFVPRQRIASRVRDAFVSGDLAFTDYRFFDSRRGFNQYNDCAVLQMITNDTHDHLADAAGPMHYLSNANGDAQCRTLFGVLNGDAARFIPTRHARYWHGYNAVAAVLLTLLPLIGARWLLRSMVYALVVLFPIVAMRAGRRSGLAAAAVSVAMLAFYALPYFAQSLTHAPGDLCVLAGLILLAIGSRHRIVLSSIFGSLFVYFDDLIGVIPVGTAFFVVFAYLIALDRGETRRAAWQEGAGALAGLAAGGAITIVGKQIFAFLVLGREAGSDFMQHLTYYVAPVQHVAAVHAPRVVAAVLNRVPILLPFAALANATRMLTWGSRAAAAGLLVATAAAWVAAFILAWRQRETRSDVLAFFTAGVGVFTGWILLAQTHTFQHAVFMVRIEIIPIALGLAALTWVSAMRSGATRRS